MRRTILPLLFLLAFSMGGCQAVAFVAYVFAPETKEQTVEPEFDQLPHHSVAVIIFAEPGVDLVYPQARLQLSNAIVHELEQKVANVKVTPASAVMKYQRDNLDWDTMPRPQLAKALNVDYVLHLSMEEYSMVEPGGRQLFRAHITADANLYAASGATAEERAWSGRIRLVHPDTEPGVVLSGDDRSARAEAHTMFAQLLVRKFYKHKIPVKQ